VAIDRRNDRRILGYAISGRDARQSFLQRLAVHPAAQRQGLGRALVLDSLRWASRWRVDRVLVNTHTTNVAALELYEGLGFQRLREQLHVFERSLAWSAR
jgi:ribosomal protein S18 acetylase RimI-like enzyme